MKGSRQGVAEPRGESTHRAPTTGLSRTSHDVAVPSVRERSVPLIAASNPVTGWAATVSVTLLALALRLVHLGRPNSLLFDETYYVKDAWSLVNKGYVVGYKQDADKQIVAGHFTPHLWLHDPSMIVHPQLGKYLIGLGELTFGLNSFGWRFPSAVAGSMMVFVMVRLARRMTGSTLLGVVAGLLTCFDGLELVLSRLGLLDIFVALFTTSAISCLVADRDWGRARLARLAPEPVDGPGWGPVRPMLWRPWRLAAGICWGLAVATKWSALYPLAAFGLLLWAWDSGARRRMGVRFATWKALVADALLSAVYLLVLPFLIYLASWTDFLLHAGDYERALSRTQYTPYWGNYIKRPAHGLAAFFKAMRDLWHYHLAVWDFQTRGLIGAHHIYQSRPLGWLILDRPVGVDAQLNIQPGTQGCVAPAGSTCLRQILLLGNPAVWWPGCVAALYAVGSWIGRRDWRFGVVVVGILSTWLPWLPYDNRPIFLYYAIMILPFVVLGLTLALGRILGPAEAAPRRRVVGAVAGGAYLLIVLALFGWFWPVWTDSVISTPHWLERIWFNAWI